MRYFWILGNRCKRENNEMVAQQEKILHTSAVGTNGTDYDNLELATMTLSLASSSSSTATLKSGDSDDPDNETPEKIM